MTSSLTLTLWRVCVGLLLVLLAVFRGVLAVTFSDLWALEADPWPERVGLYALSMLCLSITNLVIVWVEAWLLLRRPFPDLRWIYASMLGFVVATTVWSVVLVPFRLDSLSWYTFDYPVAISLLVSPLIAGTIVGSFQAHALAACAGVRPSRWIVAQALSHLLIWLPLVLGVLHDIYGLRWLFALDPLTATMPYWVLGMIAMAFVVTGGAVPVSLLRESRARSSPMTRHRVSAATPTGKAEAA